MDKSNTKQKSHWSYTVRFSKDLEKRLMNARHEAGVTYNDLITELVEQGLKNQAA